MCTASKPGSCCVFGALDESELHVHVQVATFKVRTVRAKREIDSLASRWALGTDNNLDDAAGGQHFLLARALSKSAPRTLLFTCTAWECAVALAYSSHTQKPLGNPRVGPGICQNPVAHIA